MYPKTCPECGGAVRSSRSALSVEFRGDTVSVSGIEHGQCEACAEVFLGLDEMEHLQIEAASVVRRSRGLLEPEEIRSLRSSLDMTQTAFEALLGVGAKTVVRWEKGTVFQSATADRLMRLIRAMPEVIPLLRGGELYEQPSAAKGVLKARQGITWRQRRVPSELRLVKDDSNAAAA